MKNLLTACVRAGLLAVLAHPAASQTIQTQSSPSPKAKKPPVAVAPSGPLETIVITASPLGGRDTYATNVGSLSRAELLQGGAASLGDALSIIPGMRSSGFAAGAGRPVIRGFDSNRVRILEDGLGVFDVSDVGPDHGVPIDPLAAQKIEVVRGAATLRYGSQAIGGVVNTLNNRVPLALPEQDISGEADAAYGTNGDSRELSGLVDGKTGNLAFHADGTWRKTNDYETPLGTQQNSFARSDAVSAGGSYFFTPDSHAGLAVIHYDARYGVPSDVTFIDMKQTKILERASFALGDGLLQKLTVDGGYGDYKHGEIDPDAGLLDTFLDKEWDVRSELTLNAFGPFAGAAIGAQWQDRKFSALGDAQSYLAPTHTENAALFVFTDSALTDALHLQLGGRIESIRVSGTPASGVDTDRHFAPVSLSAGLVYKPDDALKLGLTGSRASRAPAQTELFAKGPHDGPQTFETGDPALSLEHANSVEAAVNWRNDRVDLEAAAWATWFQNFIYGALTGRTCDEDGDCTLADGDFRELNYGQRDARFRGLEGKAAYAVLQSTSGTLQVQAQADYVRATFSGGGNVPRIPPYRVGGGVDWIGTALDSGLSLSWNGRQDDVATAETPTRGYVNLDAHITWRPFDDKRLEVSLSGKNLTDSVIRNAVAFNKDLVVEQGRDVRLTLRTVF